MRSFELDITANRIIILVDLSQRIREPNHRFLALLDTGATRTAISPKVVRDLGLIPTGPASFENASGELVESVNYDARVDLPVGIHVADEIQQFRMGCDLSVLGLPYQPKVYDVILGMDFIGGFHMTIFRNRLMMSN